MKRMLISLFVIAFIVTGCSAFDADVERSIVRLTKFRVTIGKAVACDKVIIQKLDDTVWTVDACKEYAYCHNQDKGFSVNIYCQWNDKRIPK